MKYRIWASVSGGITGSREAWLKVNDEPVEYATRAEAQAEADKQNKLMNSIYSVARFRYTVKEVE